MNALLERTIIERLHQLDDSKLAEVLDFVEFIRNRAPYASLPLTGLFSQPDVPAEAADAVSTTLAELAREREQSIERTIAFINSGQPEQNP